MNKNILDFGFIAFFNKKSICKSLRIDRNKNDFQDINMAFLIKKIDSCQSFEDLNKCGVKTYSVCRNLLGITSHSSLDLFCNKIKLNRVKTFLINYIIFNLLSQDTKSN